MTLSESATRIVTPVWNAIAGVPSKRDISMTKLDEFMDWLVGFGVGGGNTWAGVPVTAETAMRTSAVWACVRAYSNALGYFPIQVFDIDDDHEKELTYSHYLHRLLCVQVNPLMTPFRFKRQMEMWLKTYGNAYARMVVNDRGQVIQLWPVHPVRFHDLDSKGDTLYYVFRDKDGQPTIREPFFNVLHLRDLETDGFFGMNPIAYHRETIGLTTGLQKHGSKVFKNGAKPFNTVTAPGNWDKPKRDEFRKEWNAQHGGESIHSMALLWGGLEYKEYGMSMVDAQYVEMQHFSIEDIARIYGIPPHKIGHLLKANYNSLEQQDGEWLRDSLGPEFKNWEEQLMSCLLSERERRSVVLEFNVNYLMRADSTSRANYFSKALAGAPWMTQDEVRHAENRNPMEGDAAKFPVTNNSPAPVSTSEQTEPVKSPDSSAPDSEED
jgi:HK97 family phage portal protein